MNKLRVVGAFIQARWLRKFKTLEQLHHYQQKELAKQFRYMRKNSPYYQALTENDSFPQMDKKFMMKHFNQLNTKGIDKEAALELALISEKNRDFSQNYQGISVGLSSGTSGHRGIFITSEAEQALWAGTILGKMLPKGKLIGHKLAFFLRADNQLYQTINSKFIELTYFDTSLSINEHLSRLNTYQPTILIAPASMLVALAKAVEKKQLKIHPQRIISVAEILEETDREYLKLVFGQSVIHQIYQCTEGFLGCTCEHGNLHLNEELVFIEKEYIDDHRFYPIITDFKRTSQPIINYRLNDLLVEATVPCPCGSVCQRIEKIEGRSDDIFLFKGRSGGTVPVFPDFIRRCVLFVPNIHEYQASQISQTKIEIAIDNLNDEQEQQLKQEFRQLSEDFQFVCPTIEFVPYQWDQTVKLKRIVRKFSEGVITHEPCGN